MILVNVAFAKQNMVQKNVSTVQNIMNQLKQKMSKGAHTCAEIELTVRDKELVMRFKDYLRREGKQVFCCDDLRQFVNSSSQPFARMLTDERNNLNLGSLIQGLLRAENPNHKIKWVAWQMGKYGRRVGGYAFIKP